MQRFTVETIRCDTCMDATAAQDVPGESLLHLVTLVEGSWVRAALFPVIRLTGMVDTTGLPMRIYQDAAAEVLRLTNAPRRWTSSLSAFLQEHAVPVAAGEDRFQEMVAEKTHRTRTAVLEDGYQQEAFDFCSGRVLLLDALRNRSDVYADAVGNAGDLSLDTRFTHTLHAGRNGPENDIRELVRWLSVVQGADLRIVSLGSCGSDFFVEVESTVRQWYALFARAGWPAGAEGWLTEDLSADLRIRDSPEAVLATIRELRQQYEIERAHVETRP